MLTSQIYHQHIHFAFEKMRLVTFDAFKSFLTVNLTGLAICDSTSCTVLEISDKAPRSPSDLRCADTKASYRIN